MRSPLSASFVRPFDSKGALSSTNGACNAQMVFGVRKQLIISAPTAQPWRGDPVDQVLTAYYSLPGHLNQPFSPWSAPTHSQRDQRAVERAVLEEQRQAWARQAQVSPSWQRTPLREPAVERRRAREKGGDSDTEDVRDWYAPERGGRKERNELDDEVKEQKWTTRANEPLALMKLTNLARSLSTGSASSSLTAITHLSIDLAHADAPGDFVQVTALAISHLRHLSTFRFVGPRHSHRSLPPPIVNALAQVPVTSLGLSRIATIDQSRALDKLGTSVVELKLNDCGLQAWDALLGAIRAPVNIEGLSPPEELTWLVPSQWRTLRSLRLGHGSASVLADLLASAQEAGDKPLLDSLVIAQFEPLSLPHLIRIARTFGSSSVRKLEIGAIQSTVFSPRVVENLAALFAHATDVRIQVAGAGKRGIQACDWTQDGEYDVAACATAFSSFAKLKTLEFNHFALPHLLPLTRTPDSIADQLLATVRILAARCRRLRRVGYSFALAGHYLDVIVERSHSETRLVEAWSRV